MGDWTAAPSAKLSAGDMTAAREAKAAPATLSPAIKTSLPGFVGRFVPRLETRDRRSSALQWGCFVGAVVVALVIAIALMWASGVSPTQLAREVGATLFSGPRALAAILAQAAPLIIVGLAVAISFKVGFWNIGIEGQMILGAIAASAVALADVGGGSTRLFVMAIASMAGGIAWIAIPAVLKARLGISEVITTLLFNYLAFYFLLHLLFGPWTDPASSFPHSAQFDVVERVPDLAWQSLTGIVVLAVALVLVSYWVTSLSRVGYFMTIVGAAQRMARALGIPVVAVTIGCILASGALNGLAGFAITAGVEYRLTRDFYSGYLFAGILIAFLGRNHAIGVAIAAIFLAMLMQIGQTLQVFYGTPAALVQLIQAIFILAVAASDFFLRYRMHWGSIA